MDIRAKRIALKRAGWSSAEISDHISPFLPQHESPGEAIRRLQEGIDRDQAWINDQHRKQHLVFKWLIMPLVILYALFEMIVIISKLPAT